MAMKSEGTRRTSSDINNPATQQVSRSQGLSELNQIFLRQGSPAYATAALITFNTCDSRLCFSYAGHPAILLRQCSEKQWSSLVSTSGGEGANLPLGMFPLGVQWVDSGSVYPHQHLVPYGRRKRKVGNGKGPFWIFNYISLHDHSIPPATRRFNQTIVQPIIVLTTYSHLVLFSMSA
jgi:hypothetical protein